MPNNLFAIICFSIKITISLTSRSFQNKTLSLPQQQENNFSKILFLNEDQFHRCNHQTVPNKSKVIIFFSLYFPALSKQKANACRNTKLCLPKLIFFVSGARKQL